MASISCPSPARLRDGPDLSPSLFPNPPSPLLASPETAIHRQRRPCYSPTVSSSSPSTSSSSPSSSAASSVLSAWSPASTSAPSTSTTSASLASSSFAEKRLWSEEFRVLESDFQKFSSRTTVHKANVLRLSLLPFLRSHVGESTSVSPVELDRRLHILHKWWSAALAALRDRSSPRAVAAADRAAYFEAIFGILSRHEWRLASSHSTRDLYLVSLSDSLKLALDRLMMKPVPVSVSVFAGAVIAHAFFYLPGVAPALLYLFQVRHADVSRVQKQCGLSSFVGANLKRSAISVFPSHLAPLIVCRAPPTCRPPLPQDLSDYLYGAWAQRWWTRQDSDVFASFFKHYYIIASDYIALTSTAADITPDEAIISTPGILIIHASILRIIDGVVHCNSPNNSATPSTSSSIKRSASLPPGKADSNALPTEVNATIRTTVSSSALARQLYQMRILLAVKEVLDLSGPTCTAYASTFLRFFESTILHAAAKHTSLYDAEACVVLCDLAEAVLTTLAGATRSDHVNWSFWFDIMKQLVASESSMTEVRALSFLYSFWDNIAADSDYAAVDWVLGPAVWRKFFCHWAPLVRSYYMRLICWRVIRPASPQSRDVVDRVVDRLSSLYMALRRLAASGRPIDVTPCSPVPGRRMALVMCSGRDTAAHKFFLLSMRFRQEILSAVEFENGDRSKSKGVANRYDVHDEEVFIAAATMKPSSGPSSLSSSSASLPLSASSYSAPAASTSTSASAAKGIASVFRRFRSFKSGSTTTTTESTTTQVKQQTSVNSVSVSEQSFKSTRLRRTPSTSSTNSTSSVITSASALTMSGQNSNGFASAPGSSSTVNSLLGSEKSYCFMLQPTDAHRLQRTPASSASTPTPSASSSSTSLPLQANNSQSQLLLPRGAQIPVPRLPFARHSVMAMASQRKGASGFAAAAERKLVVATPPESSSSSFVSALRDIANSPATAAAAVVVAQNSPVPSSIATFELQPFASSSSSTSSGSSNLTTSSTSLSSLTTCLSPHSSSSSGNGNDSINTNTTSSSTSGTLPSISPHGNSLKYAGHALSEWNSVVRQYERFVEMRRKKDGIDLDLDIGTPSIIGEVLC